MDNEVVVAVAAPTAPPVKTSPSVAPLLFRKRPVFSISNYRNSRLNTNKLVQSTSNAELNTSNNDTTNCKLKVDSTSVNNKNNTTSTANNPNNTASTTITTITANNNDNNNKSPPPTIRLVIKYFDVLFYSQFSENNLFF